MKASQKEKETKVDPKMQVKPKIDNGKVDSKKDRMVEHSKTTDGMIKTIEMNVQKFKASDKTNKVGTNLAVKAIREKE